MLRQITILTLAILAGCGEQKSDIKSNAADTTNAINLEAIAKSENVYESLEQSILDRIKSDGIISVETGKAYTQLNLKKGEGNGNIPVVYLADITGDILDFIQQYSTDLFVLGYSVAGLLDQKSRQSDNPIQTYVESIESVAELSKDKHGRNPDWITLNKVLYIDNNTDKFKPNQDVKKDVSVEMCLKMLGYAYFQSGILAYLYGYIANHGLQSDADLQKFKAKAAYTYHVYEPDATGSVGFANYEDSHSAPNSKERYMYVVELTVTPKAEIKNKGMTFEQAKKLNTKIKEMHGLGGYADKLIDKFKELTNNELSLTNIPGVFKDTDRYNYAKTKKMPLVALCIPNPDSLKGKLSAQAIQIVTEIRAGLEARIEEIAQKAQKQVQSAQTQATNTVINTAQITTKDANKDSAPAINTAPATVQTTATAPAST